MFSYSDSSSLCAHLYVLWPFATFERPRVRHLPVFYAFLLSILRTRIAPVSCGSFFPHCIDPSEQWYRSKFPTYITRLLAVTSTLSFHLTIIHFTVWGAAYPHFVWVFFFLRSTSRDIRVSLGLSLLATPTCPLQPVRQLCHLCFTFFLCPVNEANKCALTHTELVFTNFSVYFFILASIMIILSQNTCYSDVGFVLFTIPTSGVVRIQLCPQQTVCM